jgi:8-oxo-dGTP diphosphatase
MTGTIIIVTSAIIRNYENKVLIVKREPNDSFPNKWEFPGGKSEYGEHPEESVKREVKEETGLTINPVFPVVVNEFKNTKKNVSYVEIFYIADLTTANQIVTLSSEHTDFSWIAFEDIHNFETTDYVHEVIRKAQSFPLFHPAQ